MANHIFNIIIVLINIIVIIIVGNVILCLPNAFFRHRVKT
jgi:hypothetical protein